MTEDIERLSRAQLEANVRALVRMLSEAQKTAAELGRALRVIGEMLLPTEMERLREEPHRPDDRSFADWLIRTLREKYGLVAVEGVEGALAQVEALQARVRELEQQVRHLEGRLHEVPRLQGEIERLQQQLREREEAIERLRRDLVEREEHIQALQAKVAEQEGHIEALQAALTHGTPSASLGNEHAPAEAVEVAEDHDQEEEGPVARSVQLSPTAHAMLQVMGDRGYCLLTHIGAVMGKDRRGLHRAKGQLLSLGLITVRQSQASAGVRGRPPEILMLTDAGRALYRDLFGREAVESEYTRGLRAHKSEEHLFLIFALRDGLLARGAVDVDVFPEPRHTEYGHFEPDIVARFRDGETLYLEAENRVKKFEQALFRKWTIRLALGLPLDVAVHTVKMQNLIVSLATRFAMAVKRPLRLRVITLERWPENALWTLERHLQP